MIKDKKLTIILDLDNTLVHTIFCPFYKNLPAESDKTDIFEFPVTGFEDDGKFVVKLRPYL